MEIFEFLDRERIYNFLGQHMGQLNAVDEYGRNCVFHAVMYGTLQNLTECLQRGADPNMLDACGMTPLLWLLIYLIRIPESDMSEVLSQWHKADLLLKVGANPNICCLNGFNSLTVAVLSGNLVMINYLLINGADPNICVGADSGLGLVFGNLKNTALSLAASMGDKNIVLALKPYCTPENIFRTLQQINDINIREALLSPTNQLA